MTLFEFAHELKRLIDFAYMTVGQSRNGNYSIFLWKERDLKSTIREEDIGNWLKVFDKADPVCFFEVRSIKNLDLSEYMDKVGNIDYSRCIIEVTDGQL